MKKQIIILLLFVAPIFLIAQKGKVIKITTPCNDKLVDDYPGIWLPQEYLFKEGGLNKVQQQEWMKRFDELFNMVKEAYPNPSGADGYWRGGATKSSFGDQVKLLKNGDVEPVKINPITKFYFSLGLFNYYCAGPAPTYTIKNEFPPGLGDPILCGVTITLNDLDDLLDDFFFDGNRWLIDERPIKLKFPVIGKWKGYDYCASKGGQLKNLMSQYIVLITRHGMLPYIPVTRKQFLDLAIPNIIKFYDDQLATIDQLPVRSIEEQDAIKNKTIEEYKRKYPNNPGVVKQYLATYTTDQQQQERKKQIILKNKEADLKKYHDELDKSTKQGLLESPAIIMGSVTMMSEEPVFTTEEQGGNMLATKNPNYFRKNLSPDVPQFIVMFWWWHNYPWSLRFKKALEEKFPIEKLQAMIDK